jgi:GAF domain-containing protein
MHAWKKRRRRSLANTRSARARGGRGLAVEWSASQEFKVPIPKDEPQRLADLRSYKILDTPPEAEFDSVTLLASQICQTPIALVSLIDSERQWFKSKVGLSISETSRDVAFCAHAIMQRDLFIVRDAAADKRFAGNPLVTSKPKIRFYAGAPLVTPDNHALGTLCVFDRVPRVLSKEQQQALRALSRHVMGYLELRRELLETKAALLERRRAERQLKVAFAAVKSAQRGRDEFLSKLRHEVRATANAIIALADQVLSAHLDPARRDNVRTIKSSARALAQSLDTGFVEERRGSPS